MSVRWRSALSSIRRSPASADVKTLLDASTAHRSDFFEFLESQTNGNDLLCILEARSALLRDAKRSDNSDARRQLHKVLGLGVREQFSEKNLYVKRVFYKDLVSIATGTECTLC